MTIKQWLIGLITIPQTLSFIIKQNKTIMEKQSEQVAKLNEIGLQLDSALGVITKVGTETDGLKQTIEDLNEVVAGLGDNATPALVDAVAAVTAKANAVSAAITAVDEKVVDAPAETPETPTE